LGRAPLGTLTQRATIEQCWTLLGTRRGRIWFGRLVDHCDGAETSVQFDGLGVLRREERRRDVMGFFHTHPDGPPRPSARDIRTMRAWCSAFGKPLLCVIASPDGLAAFQFVDDRSDGVPMMSVEVFPRGVLIGVESDGEQVSS
jgi:proteasome lid subunit RPN8/RPN11